MLLPRNLTVVDSNHQSFPQIFFIILLIFLQAQSTKVNKPTILKDHQQIILQELKYEWKQFCMMLEKEEVQQLDYNRYLADFVSTSIFVLLIVIVGAVSMCCIDGLSHFEQFISFFQLIFGLDDIFLYHLLDIHFQLILQFIFQTIFDFLLHFLVFFFIIAIVNFFIFQFTSFLFHITCHSFIFTPFLSQSSFQVLLFLFLLIFQVQLFCFLCLFNFLLSIKYSQLFSSLLLLQVFFIIERDDFLIVFHQKFKFFLHHANHPDQPKVKEISLYFSFPFFYLNPLKDDYLKVEQQFWIFSFEDSLQKVVQEEIYSIQQVVQNRVD